VRQTSRWVSKRWATVKAVLSCSQVIKTWNGRDVSTSTLVWQGAPGAALLSVDLIWLSQVWITYEIGPFLRKSVHTGFVGLSNTRRLNLIFLKILKK
jgi:hypothetical protein